MYVTFQILKLKVKYKRLNDAVFSGLFHNSFLVFCANSEKSSNNSDEKLKNFFRDSLLPIIQNPQKCRQYALSTTQHRLFPNEWQNTFFHFFIKAESKYAHFFFGFLHSNGNGVPVRALWALSFKASKQE